MNSRNVLWDPHPDSSRFIIGSSSELRLMEWQYSKDNSNKTISSIKTLSTITELGQARAFQWSPSNLMNDLVAVGLTSGKVILLRANSNASTSDTTSHIAISPRSSRPCNAVAFSADQPYLAVGLEKGRGESLMLFDIEAHSRSLKTTGANNYKSKNQSNTLQIHSNSNSNPYPPAPILSSPPGSTSTTEPKAILQFGSSESVTSTTFLSPSLLVAGMGGKFIRTYDVRAASNSVAVAWSTRSLYGIAANPFNKQQFTSFGEDGVVKLWDIRMSSDALLSFSESDAGSIPAKIRSTLATKPLVDVVWSPNTRGKLATLERESSKIRVWSLLEGSATKVDEMRMPTLLEDQPTKAFQHPLVSFAFANSPNSSSSIHLLGVSRDSANPGTSGHRIEIVELLSRQHCQFLEKSLVLSTANSFSTIDIIPSPMNSNGDNNGNGEEDGSAGRYLGRRDSRVSDTSILVGNGINTGGRGRSLSLTSIYIPATKGSGKTGEEERKRNETPRPSGSVTPRRLSRDRLETVEPLAINSVGYGGLGALARDPAVTLREKVDCGYNSNPALNALLVESSSLREFWTWIARAETLSGDACILDYDFRYRGVLAILQGFEKSNATINPTPIANNSPGSIYNDIHRSLRKGDEARVRETAFAAACSGLVLKRRLEGAFAPSSSLLSQRKLALEMCSVDWQESFEAVCLRYQRAEDFESCARFCFLNGNLEATIKNLKSCKEDSLRLLTPVLAAYISQKNSSVTDSGFSDLCRSLSSDVESPWVRSMFAFLASGDWRDVVDESGLPLKDRVAVALRFLSDHELLPFLQELGTESLASGDLEGVLLYGLRSSGLDLLQSYLNRTADVQTVALSASFVSPGLIRNDKRLERWIETYRTLLDRLRLYTSRALFDSARGRRSRILLETTKSTGRTNEASEIGKAIRALAPPQILVRCQFCSSNLSIAGGEKEGVVGTKVTSCPSCHKSLPRCAVCLSKPAEGGPTLLWCQFCRHSGHSQCLLSWFDRSNVCPVSNCDCSCTQDS